MRPEKRRRALRLASNSLSLVSNAVAIRASAFVMYVLVARYRGAFEFGQLSLASVIFAALLEIALVGVRRVITRAVAVDAGSSRSHLVDAGLLAMLGSLAGLAVAWGLVSVMGYAPETAHVIVLLAFGLWPAALTQIAESVAQGWERMHLMLAIQGPIAVAKVAAVFAVLQAGMGVTTIVWILVASHAVAAVAGYAIVLSRSPAGRARPSPTVMIALARQGGPFLGINLASAVRGSLTSILISGFLGEASVGLFNAANQLTAPIRLLYENLVSSFFPAMVRRFEVGTASLRAIVGTLVGALSAFTLPMIVTLFVLAEPILLLLYAEPEFADAAVVLMITVWAPALDTLKGVMGHALWAANRELVVLRVTLVNLAASIVAGFALIPTLGLVGAAVSVLVVALVNTVQHHLATARALERLPVLRHLWRPVSAAAAMGVVLFVTQSLGSVASLTLALLTYLVVVVGLAIWNAGGLEAARARYLATWLG